MVREATLDEVSHPRLFDGRDMAITYTFDSRWEQDPDVGIPGGWVIEDVTILSVVVDCQDKDVFAAKYTFESAETIMMDALIENANTFMDDLYRNLDHMYAY